MVRGRRHGSKRRGQGARLRSRHRRGSRSVDRRPGAGRSDSGRHVLRLHPWPIEAPRAVAGAGRAHFLRASGRSGPQDLRVLHRGDTVAPGHARDAGSRPGHHRSCAQAAPLVPGRAHAHSSRSRRRARLISRARGRAVGATDCSGRRGGGAPIAIRAWRLRSRLDTWRIPGLVARRPLTSETERAMISTRDLCFTPAIELLKLYRARKASPLEVMQEILSRVDAVNPDVNALVTLVRDSALREGVPVGIKDVTATKGKPLEPRPDRRRIELGGGAGHRYVSPRGRHRSRRLAPGAGVLLWGRRVPDRPRAVDRPAPRLTNLRAWPSTEEGRRRGCWPPAQREARGSRRARARGPTGRPVWPSPGRARQGRGEPRPRPPRGSRSSSPQCRRARRQTLFALGPGPDWSGRSRRRARGRSAPRRGNRAGSLGPPRRPALAVSGGPERPAREP